MRVVVQRVREASVTVGGALPRGAVDGRISAKIGNGLLVLAGFEAADDTADLEWMTQKLPRPRLSRSRCSNASSRCLPMDWESPYPPASSAPT